MRLFSLNIERSRHLNRFIPFLRQYDADVDCLQEVVQSDLEEIAIRSGFPHHHFAAMAGYPEDPSGQPFGVAVLSAQPFCVHRNSQLRRKRKRFDAFRSIIRRG